MEPAEPASAMADIRRLRPLVLTSFQPKGHYSQGLARAAWGLGAAELRVCTGRAEPAYPDPRVERVWGSGLGFARDVLAYVDATRPDLVHLQHEFTMFGGPLSALQVPHVCRAIRARGIPLVVTVHAVPSMSEIDRAFVRAFRGGNLVPAWALRLVIGRLLHSVATAADALIAHAPSLVRRLVEEYGARAEACHALPLGVPELPAGIAPAPEDGVLRVVCPGYVSRRKGLETVLEGFAGFAGGRTDVRLTFAGSVAHPAYRCELEMRATTLGVAGRVRFTGSIPYRFYMQTIADADLVVLNAAYSISASQPLAQARALGRAVIAPRVGAFLECVLDGEDALLYAPMDAAELAECLQMLSESPATRARLERGSESDARRRGWRVVAGDTLRLYADLVG